MVILQMRKQRPKEDGWYVHLSPRWHLTTSKTPVGTGVNSPIAQRRQGASQVNSGSCRLLCPAPCPSGQAHFSRNTPPTHSLCPSSGFQRPTLAILRGPLLRRVPLSKKRGLQQGH